jgi:hypothetical protein
MGSLAAFMRAKNARRMKKMRVGNGRILRTCMKASKAKRLVLGNFVTLKCSRQVEVGKK